MKISEKAVLESRQLLDRAWKLAKSGSAADRKEADVLLAQAATVRETGFSKEERDQMEQRAILAEKEARYIGAFNKYVSGRLPEEEFRLTVNEYWGRPTSQSYTGGNLQGGTTSGIAGGFTVPAEFFKETMNAIAQFTPLLDPDAVSLDANNGYDLRGKVYPGWDLSTYAAARVGESTQTSPNDTAAPASYAKFLSGYIYKTSLAIAVELEQDADNIVGALTKAYGVAFARGIGSDLINGTGTGQPQGLLTGAGNSGVTGAVSYTFLNNLFFSLNRFYRASKKCAWVMNDTVYKKIRALVDSQNRPLLLSEQDTETLFGKRVIISPDLNDFNASPAVTGKVLFGDLGHYRVRCTNLSVIRSLQSGLPNGVGSVDRGECLLNGRMRVDAVIHDASNGATPPVVFANVTA